MLDAMGAFVYSHNRHEAPKNEETPLQSHICGVSSCGAERETDRAKPLWVVVSDYRSLGGSGSASILPHPGQ